MENQFNPQAWLNAAQELEEKGLYRQKHEVDSCGVGLVAAIDGKPNRKVVEAGIEALRRVWHRGAVDADGKTGDGAGIHVQIPQEFFKDHVSRTGHKVKEDERVAVGQIFLPRTDLRAQEECRSVIEAEILRSNLNIFGWRRVPLNTTVIGEKAAATRPEIEQILIGVPNDSEAEEFERLLYVIRRRIEKEIDKRSINEFYICSLSCRSVIYKGMFLAEQLSVFYPDLEDERFISNFAIFHQRYSTNTFPTWKLAQPFRMLAHNGEINTINGNINWTKAHEPRMSTDTLPEEGLSDVLPVVQANGSDSAVLDNVCELLCRTGRPAPAVKALMVPESIGQSSTMNNAHKALYNYCNTVMEPWDGPAGLCITDGRWVVSGLDRNGLRPLRYAISKDNIIAIGSETGMVDIIDNEIVERGRIGPGEMIGVDLQAGKFYRDSELKDWAASRHPFEKWGENVKKLNAEISKNVKNDAAKCDAETLLRLQQSFAQTLEDIDNIITPMVLTGQEAIGSMGDDTPLAVLSKKYRPLHHYFRQSFSQVTNPPIDSLRERQVMSLATRFGNMNNVLEEEEAQTKVYYLESPILFSSESAYLFEKLGENTCVLDATFDVEEGGQGLEAALERLREESEAAVLAGVSHLVLSDEAMSVSRAAVPPILAVGALNTHLVKNGLRTFASINVRTAECLDVHYFAVLVGVGATTVTPWLTEETIKSLHQKGRFGNLKVQDALVNYKKAVDKGLLKIMSKLGIGVLSSYRGGCNFEVVGISRSLIRGFFPTMSSRISGIGLSGIAKNILDAHAKAWQAESLALPVGGFYRIRKDSEAHGHSPEQIALLHEAVRENSWEVYKKYSATLDNRDPIQLRELLELRYAEEPLATAEVQSITEIRRKFVTPAMSMGALSPEAHETLAIAMNRIGGKSNSGEGGEDPARFTPRENGDNARSAIKQIASGRFGVTAEYLSNADELQIKMAQGAKPGEGGQLPGFKVSVDIARLRHSTPGVTLISPPPHHDIYSIEDLAQLIYDLKQINPTAKVCVKLVAREGIGTIAAGVVKAGADVILVSGFDGGTGASPLSSIKYAGLPWEMGLSEVHQVLTLNKLRNRVTLRVDGGIKNGRDIVIGTCLGAEEYGFGTTGLMAMGCLMVRQCHSNTCPVGVATQDKNLRDKFPGRPEHVVNFLTFVAEEVQEYLAKLGIKSLEELVGRTDLLTQVSRGSKRLDDLDLNPILAQADTGGLAAYCTLEGRNPVPDTLDAQMVKDARPALKRKEKMELAYQVYNTHRAIGARLSSKLVQKFGQAHLADDFLTVSLSGSAGQSLGVFGVKGLTINVEGDANDYVGKGLSGGIITVSPPRTAPFIAKDNTIIGNTVLFGATAGKLFAAGQAGVRFAVRNSGATAVIEGCDSNGCEYMTGGTVAILGSVGDNFGAGMTGGMAFILDEDNSFEKRVNDENVIWQRVETSHWEGVLKAMVMEHHQRTRSQFAGRIIRHWDTYLKNIWQVVPKEMLDKLEYPLSNEEKSSQMA
ncbi:MAG: glutamate synthase large subunit [Alphaproteobacteria bacterium]